MQSINMVWHSYLGSYSSYEYKNGPFFDSKYASIVERAITHIDDVCDSRKD